MVSKAFERHWKSAKHLYQFCKNEQTSVIKHNQGKKALKTLVENAAVVAATCSGSLAACWMQGSTGQEGVRKSQRNWGSLPLSSSLFFCNARAPSCQLRVGNSLHGCLNWSTRVVHVIPVSVLKLLLRWFSEIYTWSLRRQGAVFHWVVLVSQCSVRPQEKYFSFEIPFAM